jgi:hypothetical protein
MDGGLSLISLGQVPRLIPLSSAMNPPRLSLAESGRGCLRGSNVDCKTKFITDGAGDAGRSPLSLTGLAEDGFS